ncbi:MAG: cation:dicarboxylase symporter family transporter, partial [Deltaproteobacteria bacterium]|nr:cation:dicarboxylase symporter family transporter [Deltaproteobacteria bacterium]
MKKPGLATQIIIGMVTGVILGAVFKGNTTLEVFLEPIGAIFIRMFKMIMVPIVISTLVVGVAGTGDGKSFGRLGIKTLIYFEILTTIAMLVGLTAGNLLRPGDGMAKSLIHQAGAFTVAEKVVTSHSFSDTLINIVPVNIIDSMAKADMLAVIFFSVMFGLGLGKLGDKRRPLTQLFQLCADTMFRVTNMVMLFAPFGVCAMIGLTVSRFGLSSLIPLAKLTASVYGSMIFFVLVVLGSVAAWLGISIVTLR